MTLSTRPWSLTVAGLALPALAILACSGGGAWSGALRALLVVALLGGAALFVRRRNRAAAPAQVAVLERQAFGRECGVVLLATGPRRLLVGYGAGGVQLIAEVGDRAGERVGTTP